MPRLLHCTDFHGRADWFAWLSNHASHYDAVVLSGDLVDGFASPAELRAQVAAVTAFLERFARPLCVVTGNHDDAINLSAVAARNPCVHGDGFEGALHGWRVVCIGWRRVPVMLAAGSTPVALVSHQPPDECAVSRDARGDWGGYDVRALATTLPAGSMVLSGHVHAPRSWHARVGCATAFNPGVAPASSMAPRHIVLDLDTRHARLVGGDFGEAGTVHF